MDGAGDGSGDVSLGPPPPPGLQGPWLEAQVLGPGTPGCELAEGQGREELYRLALSSDEGEACMGQTAGSRCWWKACQKCAEGRGAMHMLLDTGGLGKPGGNMPRPFTP